jgi:hypothetical protein
MTAQQARDLGLGAKELRERGYGLDFSLARMKLAGYSGMLKSCLKFGNHRK